MSENKGSYKRGLIAPGQVWAGSISGRRRIVEIKDDRVWFERLPGGSKSGQLHRPKYGDVTVERFCIWASRLLQTALESQRDQSMEVVNVGRAQGR